MEMKYLWIVIAAVFFIGELMTGSFFLVWFGIAASVVVLLAYLKAAVAVQWITFIVLSFVLFLASRRFANRITSKQPPGIGADRVIHKQGIVIEEISAAKDTGLVRVEKEQWRAVTKKDEALPVGARIKVVAIEGTSLIVEKVE